MAVKKLSVLGSTGSIGRQTLSVIDALDIKLTAISGYSNIDLLEQQALKHSVNTVCVVDMAAAVRLRERLNLTGIKVISGEEGLIEIASYDDSDTLLNAVVGIAGLKPTLEAIKAGKRIALANKETLVAGGALVIGLLKSTGGTILPVDSEHSAIFQCLEGSPDNRFKRIILTASGGPFFGYPKDRLKNITVDDALKHPNWSMGRKITVDSATLMNKGLELIEAMRLFDASVEQIDIVVHRQSIIHSMVEFADNSIIAQLSIPDMRIPIQYALTYPERKMTGTEALDFKAISQLTFEQPDFETFRCLKAAVEAAESGGLAPAVANAANERAVELFLNGKIPFLKIGEIVETLTSKAPKCREFSLEQLMDIDAETRRKVDSVI